jgi:hypothetical protein
VFPVGCNIFLTVRTQSCVEGDDGDGLPELVNLWNNRRSSRVAPILLEIGEHS